MKSLKKACALLRILAGQKQVRGRELAKMAGIPSSTAQRILRALEDVGLVEHSGGAGYRLGPLVHELSQGDSGRWRLASLARPHLVGLRDKCDETVALHVFEAGTRVVVDQVESTQEVRRTIMNLGSPMPLYAGAASKLFLASLPDREVARYLKEHRLKRFTPGTPTSPRRLLVEVRRIRRRGFAVSFQEIVPGVASIAMPIRSPEGAVIAAIGVSGPMQRVTPAVLKQVQPLLAEAVEEVSGALRRKLAEGAGEDPSPHRSRQWAESRTTR